MSKITFRADDELVQRLEEFDASKSEVMREALREYLDGAERESDGSATCDGSVDGALSARVDELIAERLDEQLDEQLDERLSGRSSDRDINVNVNVDGNSGGTTSHDEERASDRTGADERKTRSEDEGGKRERACDQCGERVDEEHVYCPNCGDKSTHRAFCECGDEVRTDWAFCPGCGRRTPAADVLDRP